MAEVFDILVLGSLNTDFAFHVEAFPLAGETLLAKRLVVSAGGKGGNQAIAAARMGSRVAMLAAVGSDARGEALVGCLAENGVDVGAIHRKPDLQTGLATILVNAAGENLIVVDQGANGALDPDDVFGERAPRARYVLAQFETPLPTIEAVFLAARERGGKCVLNAAPARPAGRRLFQLCDVLVMNEPELATYIGSPVEGLTGEALGRVATTLLTRDDQTVIVTRGRAGVVAVRRGAKMTVSAHEADAVDTTGAGDCFCGALVAGLCRDVALGAAISRANAAAAIAVGRAGATTSMPTAREVDDFQAAGTGAPARLTH